MGEKYFRQPSTTSVQQHFSAIPKADIERSTFDRSHGVKTTIDHSQLYPIFIDEVLPGDTFTCKATIFARMATPLHPVMDNLYLDTHFFFVPNRLVWTNWVNFMGERTNPSDNPESYSVPQVNVPMQRLGDEDTASYFGIPFNNNAAGNGMVVNALPFRMYKLIWNEWYRDQNLSNSKTVETGNGPDTWANHSTILPRYKRHDYFTSALPWPQKGSPVSIDLGTTAELGYRDIVDGVNTVRVSGQADLSDNRALKMNTGTPIIGYEGAAVGVAEQIGFAATNMYVDLTTATAVTINDLRTAFQIQKLLERDARGGTRYNEVVLSHFGVSMPYSNWRTEYIGGGHTMINVTPIATTFANTEIATGDLGAVVTGLGTAGFQKSFTEHGFVIGLISVRGDLNYQNGTERFWFRRTRYDYYWPVLAHLSEQAILNREIWTKGGVDGQDTGIWGYQERFAEYRYKPGRITGAMNSNHALSLDTWHVAQDFADLPPLNEIFMIDAPSMARVLAVADTKQKFIVDGWFDLKCQRPMPTYSVPGLVDHF